MAQSMNDISTLGGTSSIAYGVSADGKVIVGSSYLLGASNNIAFKYTNGTMTSLDTLGGTFSIAYGVSSGGTVIVGFSRLTGSFDNTAFIYTNGTMTDLGVSALGGIGTRSSIARAVSADGSVIVGDYIAATGSNRAFKWQNGVLTNLGNLGYAGITIANGVSADGSVIVGYSTTDVFQNDTAFKYENGVMTSLGTLGGTNSIANGVSADGKVIVGYSNLLGSTNRTAFKYENGSMTSLGTLGGTRSVANGVSADGSVIVGYSYLLGASNNIAFKYTNGTMTSLGTLGGATSTATGVSSDGLVIVGYSSTGSQTHAFVYGAWANGGLVDVDNTYSAIAANGYQLNSLLNAQNTALAVNLNSDCTVYDAHNVCVSVGGRYTNVGSPTVSQTAANIQLGYRFSPSFRAGVFLDQSFHNNAPSNYSVKNSQPLAGLFAVYSPSGTHLGLQVKASVAYSHKDVDITRPSLAFTEAGQGSTAMTTQGAQLETAYGFAVNDSWVASPLAGIRATSVVRNGYTETAGALFPVTYNSATRTGTTAYVGAKVMGYVTPKMTVGVSAGVERDLNSNISDNSGSIYYLGAYSLAAPDMSETRHFVAANADYSFEKNQRVSLSAYYNKQSLNASHGTTATLNYMIGF